MTNLGLTCHSHRLQIKALVIKYAINSAHCQAIQDYPTIIMLKKAEATINVREKEEDSPKHLMHV